MTMKRIKKPSSLRPHPIEGVRLAREWTQVRMASHLNMNEPWYRQVVEAWGRLSWEGAVRLEKKMRGRVKAVDIMNWQDEHCPVKRDCGVAW